MEVWMILMATLFFFGASFGQSPDPNEFSVSTYAAINSELQKCAIPSAKMFEKSIPTGVPTYSTFDSFCYFQALQNNDQMALFMCRYYRFLVKTYYDDFCKSDSPAKKPLDKSVQYADFVSNPDAVCNYLQQNLQTADQQKVFNSPDECTRLCGNAFEFCRNFGFILSIANSKLKFYSELIIKFKLLCVLHHPLTILCKIKFVNIHSINSQLFQDVQL